MFESRRHAAVSAGLLMLGLAAVPAGAQQSKNVAIVNAVLGHRAHWIGDSTRVDACSVYEALGRPLDFPAGINPDLVPLLDRTRDPCAGDSTRVAVRRPGRFVRFSRVQANGNAAPYVELQITKSPYSYQERYTLHTWESGGSILVRVDEVRTYFLLQEQETHVYPQRVIPIAPPQRRKPDVRQSFMDVRLPSIRPQSRGS